MLDTIRSVAERRSNRRVFAKGGHPPGGIGRPLSASSDEMAALGGARIVCYQRLMIWRRTRPDFQDRTLGQNEMAGWNRIGDDEIARWGVVDLKFEFFGGVYSILLDEDRQQSIRVKLGDLSEVWPINLKHQKDGRFMISGLADTVPEILEQVCWFELLLGPTPSIEFLGSDNYRRVDKSCA